MLSLTFSQVSNILNIHDVPNIWHIPLLLRVSFLNHNVFFFTRITIAYDHQNFVAEPKCSYCHPEATGLSKVSFLMKIS